MTIQNPSRNLLWGRVLRIGGVLTLLFGVFYFIAQIGSATHQNALSKASVDELQTEAAKDPENETLLYTMARRMVADGNSVGAFEVMQKLVKMKPDSKEYWDGYARCAAASNNLLESVHGYRRILELDPRSASAHSFLGQIEIKAGLVTEGLGEIDTAHKIDPNVGINVVVWAQGLIEKKRIQEAYDAVTHSLNVDPTQDGLYPLYWRLGLQVGKADDTEALLWRRIEISPMYAVGNARNALVHLMLTESHSAKTLAEAKQIALAAVTGKSAASNSTLAEVLIAQKDLGGARKTLEEGLSYDAKSPACLELLAQVAQKQGKPEEAAQWRAKLPAKPSERPEIVALSQAVAAAPEDMAKRMTLAQALAKAEEYGPAAETCMEILQRLPNDKDAETLLGKCREEALHKLARTPEVLNGKN